ncbi:MAG: hypothetical protein ACYS4W_04730 [Planctomycetota bacterium]|jgi:hypothetical protein
MLRKLFFSAAVVSVCVLASAAQGAWCMAGGALCAPADEVDLCDLYGPPPIVIHDDFETCDYACLKASCDIHFTGRLHVGQDCDQQLRIYSGNVTISDRIYIADSGPEIGRLIVEGDAVLNQLSTSSRGLRCGDGGGQPRIIFRDDAIINNNGGWTNSADDGAWVCIQIAGNAHYSGSGDIRIGDDGAGELHIGGGTVICTGSIYLNRRSCILDWGPFYMTAGEVYCGGEFIIFNWCTTFIFDMVGGTINARNWDVHRGPFNHKGILNMTGGLIIARESFNCPRHDDGAIAHAQLDGGEVRCNELRLPVGGTIDITGGKLVINGNKVAQVGTLACVDGRLTGYGHPAGVVVAYDAASDKTVVTADPDFDPLATYCPTPPTGALVKCVSEDVILTWKGAQGTRDFVDRYFGPDKVCVETRDPACFAGRWPASRCCVWNVGKLPLWSTHYWALDTVYYGGPTVLGPVWSFTCGCHPMKGDFNNDCVVNWEDWAILAESWGKKEYWPKESP